MYILSINSFATSWLLICLINPLYGVTERSYKINDVEDHQFRPPQSGQVLIKEQLRPNVSKSPQHDIYHHSYQHNSLQMPSKDVYPEAHVKQNVTKSIAEYQMGKDYRPYYYPESQYIGDQENLKKENATHSSESKQHYEEARRRDEEIMKKMNALDKLLSEDTEENDIESGNMVEDRIIAESIPEETKRVVRQVRKQRPGFFWTLARIAFETFNDTRSAIKQINNIINENIVPDTVRPPVSRNPLMVDTKTVTSSVNQSNTSNNMAGVNVTTMRTTTTEAPFRFTRNGLQDLIRRNLRGLVRLFNIEWQDALNQSDINVKEFQKNLGNQVGSFLQDNPNAF